MKRTQIEQRQLTAIQNIRHLVIDAIRSGVRRVEIPVLKNAFPRGDEIHIGERCGPRGVWNAISATGRGLCVFATFDAIAVLGWCNEVLENETAAV